MEEGDVVLFNRQPSLHMHGMQAHRVTLMPGDTFRLNLVVAAPYNADFDGDEMNLHVPQSKAAAAECETLMAVAQNCIGDQANKPVMGIVQDALLGLFLVAFDRMVRHELALQRRYVWRERTWKKVPVPVRTGGSARACWGGVQMILCLSLNTTSTRTSPAAQQQNDGWASDVLKFNFQTRCDVQ